MKYLFLVIVCFLFQTAFAQSQPLSCRILQLIAADVYLFTLDDVATENDAVILDKNGKVVKRIDSDHSSGEYLNFVTLIDSKKFFSRDCNTQYRGHFIRVADKMSDEYKRDAKAVFLVSEMKKNKADNLSITILQPATQLFITYEFALENSELTLVDKKKGYL